MPSLPPRGSAKHGPRVSPHEPYEPDRSNEPSESQQASSNTLDAQIIANTLWYEPDRQFLLHNPDITDKLRSEVASCLLELKGQGYTNLRIYEGSHPCKKEFTITCDRVREAAVFRY